MTSCAPDPASDGAASVTRPDSSRLSELLRDDSTDQFPKAVEPREFHYPRDHGAHEEFRNEWWYFTGNLDTELGRRFGYELTLFRFSLTPEVPVPVNSDWQTNQVYVGHFAVTDVQGEAFLFAQRYSRGSVGLAGATESPLRIWLDDWSVETAGAGEQWRLAASDNRFAISLSLTAAKPIVLQGERGLSQKSAEPGNASYYYSIPRLDTVGTLRLGEREFDVSGQSWLDREWGSSALSRDQRGWDWFALQLSDGSDLMFYTIRKNDGQPDEHSAGMFIGVDGQTTSLSYNDVNIEVLDTWSSAGGGTYPAKWRMNIPARNLQIEVVPVLDNQELITNVRYWEGAVDVTGRAGMQQISGRGYVELTGYADP
ncbi:MAG: lipocalin-like domain-containing protein [Gammaproteobacteria bacterium]